MNACDDEIKLAFGKIWAFTTSLFFISEQNKKKYLFSKLCL